MRNVHLQFYHRQGKESSNAEILQRRLIPSH